MGADRTVSQISTELGYRVNHRHNEQVVTSWRTYKLASSNLAIALVARYLRSATDANCGQRSVTPMLCVYRLTFLVLFQVHSQCFTDDFRD
jgi:hypothetical protein